MKEPDIKVLKDMFRETIGIPLPKMPIDEKELVYLNSLLFGSKSASKEPFVVQGSISRFIKSCPKGYFLTGFWGHGVNSYAFYYSRVDSRTKILFRLPYGGAYMDNELQAKYIREFLPKYFEFEEGLISRLRLLIAIDSMDEGYYKIVVPGVETFELRESMLMNPNFKERYYGCSGAIR